MRMNEENRIRLKGKKWISFPKMQKLENKVSNNSEISADICLKDNVFGKDSL